jgi:transposase
VPGPFFEDVWNSTYEARAGSHHWDRRHRDYRKRRLSVKVRLGIDIACRAHHQASATDETGEFLWSGWRFRTTPADLEALWAKLPEGAEVTVIMEPTRNAWVPLAAWLKARDATVVLVAPERSADLRDYYAKHTKTDRLDSRMLARLPLLHPEGLEPLHGLGPADTFKRTVRRRWSLVERRHACCQRLDALVEMLGPSYAEVLGATSYTDTAFAVLERYSDPRALRRLGRQRLTDLVRRVSRGHFAEAKADELLAAADEALSLWAGGGLDFAELAADIASEIRVVRALGDEISRLDARIEGLYHQIDPEGIVLSAPGLGVTLAAGILGRFGDLDRFANLAGVRSFTGLVPKIDQSGNSHGHGGPTKSGDPGLRMTLFLAADHARRADPQLAAKYYRLVVEQGKHHDSALCHLAATLATRVAACWRRRERYVLRDLDGREVTEAEGRAIIAERYRISDEVRQARRTTSKAKKLKGRTGRRSQKSTGAAPASGPSTSRKSTRAKKVA